MSTVLVPRKEARAATSDVLTRRGLPRGRLDWHACAPPRVAQADGWHDDTPGWAAWAQHLATRSWPAPLACWTGRRSPLAWALPGELAESETAALIGSLHRRAGRARGEVVAEQLRAWLAESDEAPADAPLGLESLAWCHALRRLAPLVTAEAWWGLLTRLADTASDAAALDLAQQPWPQQVLAVELPLTLGWCFPELEPCRQLVAGGRRRLGSALDQLLDADGLPTAFPPVALRPLLACWSRCLAIGQCLEEDHWSEGARERFAQAVRHALRLTRRDGSQAGDGPPTKEYLRGAVEMLASAVSLTGDDDLQALAAAALGTPQPHGAKKAARKTTGRPAARRKSGALPHAGISSERSQVAVLRCDWRRGSPLLVAGFGADAVSIELSSGHDVLLAGRIETEIRLDGQPVAPTGRWESICWESDEAMDYLELELNLERGVRIERQLLLAREARLLLMADAVTNVNSMTPSPLREAGPGEGPSAMAGAGSSNHVAPATPQASWEYRSRLPLAAGVSFSPADETRDGRLHGGGRGAAVIPLALGEWKTDGRGGGLHLHGEHLELRLAARGKAFYAPLILDLNARRCGRPLTWRRLTVAENRQNQPPDTAAAFRVQIGREQWVVYRSLTGPANRTLLGLNTYSEFLLGRFARDGECKPILEIEPA